MSNDREWLEYRLEALEFHNGAKLVFKSARMLYRDDNREILVDRLGMPPGAVDRILSKAGAALSPIKTIFYEMRFAGYPREAFFFHPLQRGARVFLEPRPNGQNVIYFSQAAGRPIFSKEWTAREVTAGRVPLDRAVWQFHGYKHEH